MSDCIFIYVYIYIKSSRRCARYHITTSHPSHRLARTTWSSLSSTLSSTLWEEAGKRDRQDSCSRDEHCGTFITAKRNDVVCESTPRCPRSRPRLHCRFAYYVSAITSLWYISFSREIRNPLACQPTVRHQSRSSPRQYTTPIQTLIICVRERYRHTQYRKMMLRRECGRNDLENR